MTPSVDPSSASPRGQSSGVSVNTCTARTRDHLAEIDPQPVARGLRPAGRPPRLPIAVQRQHRALGVDGRGHRQIEAGKGAPGVRDGRVGAEEHEGAERLPGKGPAEGGSDAR